MPNHIKLSASDLSFSYNGRTILQDVNVSIRAGHITAITGPSGTGKSTFLSILNRLWEETGTAGSLQGEIRINFAEGSVDIYRDTLSISELRRRVGMVFQLPNPLPMSIYKNIAFPLKLINVTKPEQVDARVEAVLQQVQLFDEVKDRLLEDARSLSGGQQQRLCIARALMLQPEILLLDEPTSSLDAKACEKIEKLLLEIKNSCTLIMVSHYQDQVQRIADCAYELASLKLRQTL